MIRVSTIEDMIQGTNTKLTVVENYGDRKCYLLEVTDSLHLVISEDDDKIRITEYKPGVPDLVAEFELHEQSSVINSLSAYFMILREKVWYFPSFAIKYIGYSDILSEFMTIVSEHESKMDSFSHRYGYAKEDEEEFTKAQENADYILKEAGVFE